MDHTMKEKEIIKEDVPATEVTEAFTKKRSAKQDAELLAALENAMKRIADLEVKLNEKFAEKAPTVNVSAERKRIQKEQDERKRQEDTRPVTGIFMNRENPGMEISFYHRVHKDDPLKIWTFQDGKTYTIPKGVAMHIIKDLNYMVNEALEGYETYSEVERKVVRAWFQSPDLMDEAGTHIETPSIAMVKTVF